MASDERAALLRQYGGDEARAEAELQLTKERNRNEHVRWMARLVDGYERAWLSFSIDQDAEHDNVSGDDIVTKEENQ